MSKDIEIEELMDLCKNNKYATTVTGFEVIDYLDQIEIPKKLRRRKPTIKAIYILKNNLIKSDYIGEEERLALRKELNLDKVPDYLLEEAMNLANSELHDKSSSLEAAREEVEADKKRSIKAGKSEYEDEDKDDDDEDDEDKDDDDVDDDDDDDHDDDEDDDDDDDKEELDDKDDYSGL